jgi:hypothetical protein
MMTGNLMKFVSRKAAWVLAGAIGVATVGAAAQPAQAGFRVGIDLHDGGGWEQPPRVAERTTQVWVPATYRTVMARTWIPPLTRAVTERVWVPDRYEDRDVVRNDGWHRRIERVRVLVEPAHYEDQTRQVEVAGGYWQDAPRQELVAPAHWETRVERVAYVDPHPVVDHVHLEFGHR